MTRPAWRIAALFVLGYVGLQLAWVGARGSIFEQWLIDDVTARTSVALINTLWPEVGAVASGPSIFARGGGINIRNGCEGTELFIPVLVALFAYPFSMRTRIIGLASGTALVFFLNQARLLALFFSFRNDPQLFGALHGFGAPLMVIVCLLGFFAGLQAWDRPRLPDRERPHA